MPRSRPNRRDYVTVQLQRMMGKKNKPPTLIVDDPVTSEQNTADEQQSGQSSSEPKTFRTPSIPSASVAAQPDIWRRHDYNPGFTAVNESATEIQSKPQVPLRDTDSRNVQETSLPPIQVHISDGEQRYSTEERVQHNPSRYDMNGKIMF